MALAAFLILAFALILYKVDDYYIGLVDLVTGRGKALPKNRLEVEVEFDTTWLEVEFTIGNRLVKRKFKTCNVICRADGIYVGKTLLTSLFYIKPNFIESIESVHGMLFDGFKILFIEGGNSFDGWNVQMLKVGFAKKDGFKMLLFRKYLERNIQSAKARESKVPKSRGQST